jgi:hypothetical protein
MGVDFGAFVAGVAVVCGVPQLVAVGICFVVAVVLSFVVAAFFERIGH